MVELKEVETPKDLEYKFNRTCLGYEVLVKLPRMRKVGEFSIYPPRKDSKVLYFQDEKACFCVEIATGKTIYTNKGACPMDYYLKFKPTYKTTLPMKFIEDTLKTVMGDKRYDMQGGVVTDFSC